MKYLLDVNSLIAIGHLEHAMHARVAYWLRDRPSSLLHTCSITELGFVRILSQAETYGISLESARSLLQKLKQSPKYSFSLLADANDVSLLPDWVKSARQTTDGHLLQLARTHGAMLATLDTKIPGAFMIP